MFNGKKKYYIDAEVEVPYVRFEGREGSVEATDPIEAQKIFTKDLESQGFKVTSTTIRTSAIPGIVSLCLTLFLSFFKYYETNSFNYIYLYPGILSVFLSLLLYSSFVIRVKGVQNVFKNPSDTIVSILFILVLAMFIQILTGSSTIPSGIIGKFLSKIGFGNNYVLIILAIVFSWLGIEQICGIVWIVIILLSITELVTCGNYMGNIKASIFLISAFCGFVFFLQYEGKVIMDSLKSSVIPPVRVIKSDINETRKHVEQQIHSISPSSEQKKSFDTVPLCTEEEDKHA